MMLKNILKMQKHFLYNMTDHEVLHYNEVTTQKMRRKLFNDTYQHCYLQMRQ